MTIAPIAKDSADVFGYTTAFEEALKEIGQISPQEFARRYTSKAKYLPQISFDPTTAEFWDDFHKKEKFRLNAEELAIFKKNGFVVSERLGGQNFADLFYRIYSHDLPVFVSADALLHAWHRSYDAILEELEETYLSSSLSEILEGMQKGIPDTWNQYGSGVLSESVKDADYFLAVARSLLADKTLKTYLKQDARVAETLEAIKGQKLQEFELFGRERKVDFSQFKVCGHYENSELLKRYFRAMMWCGRIDLRIAGSLDESSPRELGAAVILYDLLKQSGKFEQWQKFDQLLQTFVGRTDSMTFAQLGDILDKAKIKSPTDVKNWGVLLQLEADILASKIGVQHIRSHSYVSPFGLEKIKLPRSFTILGQKFVVDSWVTSKVVFDDIEWDGQKVQRRVPTCLDVAFAALGNDQVVPELVARMTDKAGRPFRDGFNYQHNLAAVKSVIDEQNPAVWEENIYMSWLATLRELSAPTTDRKYPEAMSTRGWAMKTLNTQLASWTQLRHDTILYVKQSYTSSISCYYPAGFVEPKVEFWKRFEKMALLAADLIEKIPFSERLVKASDGWGNKIKFPLQYVQERQTTFFKNFAEKLSILKGIAVKQVAQEKFTEAETEFLRKIVEIIGHGSMQPTYSGWYFGLFYKGHEDSKKQDAIVADVHTNVPAPGDPGCVLHQGVGNVDLLMIAVDNGENKMVYAGPVLSHYEFEMPGVSRLSDSEWLNNLKIAKVPPRPNWTNSYLAPKEIFQLTNQTSLNLAGKQLTELPKEIGNLTDLTWLYLNRNQLATLPPEIGNLINLRVLSLENNRLTKLPKEIGNLSHLRGLYLSGNYQLKVLPKKISNLTNLTQLNLSSNQLKVLPKEIGNLTNLTQLNLSSNQLKVLPKEIGNLTNLTLLDLNGNQLTELPPEIGNLTNLEVLYLSRNQLTALPKEIGNLTNLTELDLSENENVLPAEIGNLTNLRRLYLNRKQLTVLVPEIGNLTNLKTLSLKDNQLIALPPEIGKLTQLKWLDINKNQLRQLPPEIGNLTNLTELYLYDNQLTALPKEIGNLTNLTKLHLYKNKLMALPPEMGRLTNLIELYLDYNQLTALPPEIGNLTNLTQLSFYNNQLISPSPEIVKQGTQAILAYLREQLVG
ncbi:DUF3160 domain-containing protein [Allocoleopsis franciscana]|uniref:Leucine-rich repeat (LRR) protein n=1 Tax=Allocoleopsis franciscana PCC 7113 TaxID=1173027 RepID=K9WFB6_9CYAN|nr:DUF3160 domain-containing protein [Allocoleopsis franciscana]AFZ18469.1 leucine-rich repeat (LRR) protein [Allocoleopsis franciscana PCC 7113]